MELFQVFSINKTPKSQIITALIKSHLPPGILCQIATGQKTRQKPFSPSLLWHLAPYLLQPQIDRTSKAKEAPLMKGRRPCRPLHPISKFGSDSQFHKSTRPSLVRKHAISGNVNGCDLWICQLKLLPLPFFAVFHRAAKVQKRTNALPGGIKIQIRALNGGPWSGIRRKVLYGHWNLQWNVSTAVWIQNLHEIGTTV